ncbi:MAG: sugar MFS transporter [Bacteroidia bacterium]
MNTSRTNYRFAFAIVTLLFFLWGFITVLNDILIPHLQDVFQLSYTESMLVQFAFFLAYGVVSLIYFFVSLSSGDPISKIGYRNGIVYSLVICGIGCLLFYVAAEQQVFYWFLIALFVLASGVTLLQIAANPYVAILGAAETSSSRLNLAQAFNSLGTTLAPIIGGYLIFRGGIDGVDAVKIPYIGIALAFWILAIAVRLTPLPAFSNNTQPGTQALRFSHLRFGMLAIFFYVGGEVAIGSLIIKFIGLPTVMNLPKEAADTYLAYYWGGAMIGRFLGAIMLSNIRELYLRLAVMLGVALSVFGLIFWITDKSFSSVWPFLIFMGINFIGFVFAKANASRMLAVFAAIVMLLIFAASCLEGQLAMWCLLAIGLFNSVMWSNIFTLAIRGLGPYTSQGSSLLVMMIIGGALIPLVIGKMADKYGLQVSIVFVIVCYAYLVFYGVRGYQQKQFLTADEVQEKTDNISSTH